MDKFLERFVVILDTEDVNITMDMLLEDIIEWDSLSKVSFLAMADIKYSKKILTSDIKIAKTVRDLYSLVAGE